MGTVLVRDRTLFACAGLWCNLPRVAADNTLVDMHRQPVHVPTLQEGASSPHALF